MTQLLRQLCGGEITIKVVQEKFCDIDGIACWQRDIEMVHQGKTLVSASTIISAKAANGKLKVLRELGKNPLGDWLFKQDYKLASRKIIDESHRNSTYTVLGETLTLKETFHHG